ncbi:hypothetical protein BDD12DRAFT_354410 [Trichophaea hybrida]|nr:hypothetical protein BDD12DRAFT_354410 [Trichophaea hybrida]
MRFPPQNTLVPASAKQLQFHFLNRIPFLNYNNVPSQRSPLVPSLRSVQPNYPYRLLSSLSVKERSLATRAISTGFTSQPAVALSSRTASVRTASVVSTSDLVSSFLPLSTYSY